MVDDKLLTIPEFANQTGLTYFLARALVVRGDIPSVLCGARRRVSSRFVEGWLSGSRPDHSGGAPLTRQPACQGSGGQSL
jgi:hypothetical protein